MYSFENSVVLSRSIGSQWEQKDLSDILVYDIFNNYIKVYLVLSNPALPEHVYVDFNTLREEFSSYRDVLSQLLTDLGTRSLPTVIALPSTEPKTARYSDAFRSEYKIALSKIGYYLDPSLPASEFHDLEITRPKYKTELSYIHKYCLVSVNGLYHMTDTDDVKAYVYDGALSLRKSNCSHLGILSFLSIGALDKVKIPRSNIMPQMPDQPLKNKICFNVDADLANKSYILILGGYMVFPEEGVFWLSGDNTFTLDIQKIPYLERLLESDIYLDLESLGLYKNDSVLRNINIEEAYSDDVLRNYLTMSQSFLVVVDIPVLTTNKIFIRHSNLPGMFTAYQDPVYPLVVGYGKTAEYWKVYEDEHWAVNVQDSYYRDYVINNITKDRLINANNHLLPFSTNINSRGFMLEITGFRT